MFTAALEDLRHGVAIAEIAAAFHFAVADLVLDCCLTAREKTGRNTVGLSGGVFQNTTLLALGQAVVGRQIASVAE